MNILLKKGMVVLAGLSVGAVLTACGDSDVTDSAGEAGNVDEVYELTLSHVVSEDHASHIALTDLSENLEEKSDGQITLDVRANGELYGADREALEAVQMGNIEMTTTATPTVASFNEKFLVFDLPFMFESTDQAREKIDGELGETLNQSLETNGLVGLGYGENGFRHIANNEGPIEEIDDLSGLTMRVIENPLYQDAYNELGANASPLSFSELYSALQQGTFDGMDNPISLIYSMNFNEVTDFLTLTHQTYAPIITIINKEVFDGIPEDLQQLLKEETRASMEYQRELTAEQDELNLEELIEGGMEVNELGAEQEQVFREALQPIYDKYSEEIGQDIIDLAQQ